mmetsp:Transcript_2663/g.6231  ORF Transcript_2663/g.6231 Transcript_2663/m.6231 type:complete len:285 (+) Transcript_2663:165-1019(+)
MIHCGRSSIKGLFLASIAYAPLVLGLGWSAANKIETAASEKVKVELYYESQCPGCRQLITTSFSEAFKAEGFLDMADVQFIPYGNAQETPSSDGTFDFQCQHGPSECIYNLIETCALAKIQDPIVSFDFIDCIEHNDESRGEHEVYYYYEIAMSCAKLVDLADATISQMEQCALSKEGNELEHEAALRTDSLDPPHKYVPHVVVDGEHTDEIQDAVTDSLLNYVCGAYDGPEKSAVCSAVAATNLRVGADNHEYPPAKEREVCYRRDGSSSTTIGEDTSTIAEE